MTEQMTLNVSDMTVQRARQTAQQTNRPIESVLSEWLDQASAAADIAPLDTHSVYRIDTLFGAESTARSLLELLNAPDNPDHQINTQDHAV